MKSALLPWGLWAGVSSNGAAAAAGSSGGGAAAAAGSGGGACSTTAPDGGSEGAAGGGGFGLKGGMLIEGGDGENHPSGWRIRSARHQHAPIISVTSSSPLAPRLVGSGAQVMAKASLVPTWVESPGPALSVLGRIQECKSAEASPQQLRLHEQRVCSFQQSCQLPNNFTVSQDDKVPAAAGAAVEVSEAATAGLVLPPPAWARRVESSGPALSVFDSI